MSQSPNQQAEEHFQPVAGLLALVLPGLGHAWLGSIKRGVLIAAGILGLFFGGLLLAGLDAVDSGLYFANKVRTFQGKTPHQSEGGDPIWFAGQMFVGPVAFAVDAVHQYGFKIREPIAGNGEAFRFRPPLPDEQRQESGPTVGMSNGRNPGNVPSYRRALGRVGEIGTLACMIAGLLNLIAVIDASWHAPRTGRRRRVEP